MFLSLINNNDMISVGCPLLMLKGAKPCAPAHQSSYSCTDTMSHILRCWKDVLKLKSHPFYTFLPLLRGVRQFVATIDFLRFLGGAGQ